MGGHSLASVEMGDNGIPGDRSWALRDNERGGFKVGKRVAAVMGLSANLVDEPKQNELSAEVMITLANGNQISSKSQDIDNILSGALGVSVSLSPLVPKDQLDYYRRRPPDPNADVQASLREVFARTDDEPLPDLRGFPQELFEYESPPGTYFDAFELLVVTQQSLASLAAHNASSRFDVRRFRPNIVLDADQSGYPEETWVGKLGRIGDAVIEFVMPCPRCVMTTHGFADLPKDAKIMRSLVQANDGNLGVYAKVKHPGAIRVGDRLELT